jgi:hypothetical protein
MSEPTFEDELASAEQAYSLAESELSALRAEVETLTNERDGFKALLWNIHMNLELSQNMTTDQMRHALDIIRALSEAGE